MNPHGCGEDFRSGKMLAQTPAATSTLHLDGRPKHTGWMLLKKVNTAN